MVSVFLQLAGNRYLAGGAPVGFKFAFHIVVDHDAEAALQAVHRVLQVVKGGVEHVVRSGVVFQKIQRFRKGGIKRQIAFQSVVIAVMTQLISIFICQVLQLSLILISITVPIS